MDKDIKDLVLISYQAQCNYIANRIYNKKNKIRFKVGMHQALQGDIEWIYDNCKYYEMAFDMYYETVKNLTKRFVTGRSGDALLEKL